MSAPNWLGLLKWTLAHSDGTQTSTATEMSEDDKAFLEKVMREAVKDEPARMKEIMTSFMKMIDEDSCLDNKEQIEDDLDELRDMVDQVDMAQVFVKFGGLECLMRLLEMENLAVGLRSTSASVIATLSQNNLAAQDIMFGNGTMDRLSKLYLRTELPALQSKIFHAISCLVRNHPAAEVDFTIKYAQDIFNNAIHSDDQHLKTRSFYLLASLLKSDSATVGRLFAVFLGAVPFCFQFANASAVDTRESLFHLLFTVSQTAVGHAALNANFAELESSLSSREAAIAIESAADPESVEQGDHEMRLIVELRQALAAQAPIVVSSSSALMISNTA